MGRSPRRDCPCGRDGALLETNKVTATFSLPRDVQDRRDVPRRLHGERRNVLRRDRMLVTETRSPNPINGRYLSARWSGMDAVGKLEPRVR